MTKVFWFDNLYLDTVYIKCTINPARRKEVINMNSMAMLSIQSTGIPPTMVPVGLGHRSVRRNKFVPMRAGGEPTDCDCNCDCDCSNCETFGDCDCDCDTDCEED